MQAVENRIGCRGWRIGVGNLGDCETGVAVGNCDVPAKEVATAGV